MAKKISRAKAVDPAVLFKVLADRNRYRAIRLLIGKPKGVLVGDVAKALSMGHSATSHLLGFLHTHDIVSYEKEGRTVRYSLSLTSQSRAVVRILQTL